MANAGLHALAGVLQSLGGSGGDKILDAVKTYGRNKYLAEFGKKFGAFGEEEKAVAPTPPTPPQVSIAQAALAAQGGAPAPSPLDVISGLAPKPPQPPVSLTPGQAYEQTTATMGRDNDFQLRDRAREFQEREFNADPSYAKKLSRLEQMIATARSSPYGQQDLAGLIEESKLALADKKAEDERVRKNVTEQSRQSLKASELDMDWSREYNKQRFVMARDAANRAFTASENDKDRNLRSRLASAQNALRAKGMENDQYVRAAANQLANADQARKSLLDLSDLLSETQKAYVPEATWENLSALGLVEYKEIPDRTFGFGTGTKKVPTVSQEALARKIQEYEDKRSAAQEAASQALEKSGLSVERKTKDEKPKAEKPKSEVKKGSVNGVNYEVTIRR